MREASYFAWAAAVQRGVYSSLALWILRDFVVSTVLKNLQDGQWPGRQRA